MATKTTRYVDDVGRVLLPNHIRKALNLQKGTALEVELEDTGTIRIRCIEERCVLCGESVEGKPRAELTIGPDKKYVCCACAQAVVTNYKK